MFSNSIQIKNFGPISDANIDISDMTVLMGLNSSGKSFTSLLTHIFLNPFIHKNFHNGNTFSFLASKSFQNLIKNDKNIIEKYSDYFKNYIKNNSLDSELFIIPKDDFENLIYNGVGDYYKQIIEENLKDAFKVSNLDKLIMKGSNSFFIHFNNMLFIKEKYEDFYIKDFSKFLFDTYFKDNNVFEDSMFTIKKEDNGNYYIKVNKLWYSSLENTEDFSFEFIYSVIARDIFKHLVVSRSFYIPSGCDEILSNKNSSISQNINGLFDFSYVQTELASNLLDIFPESEKSEFFEIASNIEEDILKGVIDVEYKNGNTYFFFKNAEEDIVLPFDLVSSAVKELAPFILYLKFILKKGDVVIIEEPEAHLHPVYQRKLVKYFVEAVNKGLNIIITTHSDYISDQFNNNIRLANIPQNVLKKEFDYYDENHVLDFKKISLYLYESIDFFSFKTLKLPINHTGFREDNFANASHELYDETIKIINLEEV